MLKWLYYTKEETETTTTLYYQTAVQAESSAMNSLL